MKSGENAYDFFDSIKTGPFLYIFGYDVSPYGLLQNSWSCC